MSWRKYFTAYTPPSNTKSVISGNQNAQSPTGATIGRKNYQSFLPEVYSGQSNRVDRYYQYELMDQDPEITAALDIIAEFCTEINYENNTNFNFHFLESPTQVEMTLLNESLQAWYRLNNFDRRMFRLFRNTLKYGDQFLIRDPENYKLYHADARNCEKVIVNESLGKEPEQYVFKDININLQSLSVTQLNPGTAGSTPYNQAPSIMGATAPRGGQYNFSGGGGAGGRFDAQQNQTAIQAEHVVHLSLNEGLDANWPFGMSILENIFKTFKQKELIEDAIIIYRVQRAPERRVFYVDVGNLPSHLAMQYVERVKNEIHQRRIPSMSGGQQNIMDATYNPLSINEDYFFPQSCLALDTKIPLLSGQSKTLQELIQDHEAGVENWVYGLDNTTHELEPAKILWAGVTRKDAQVVKVTLDNGEHVIATPDHRFITRNGEEVEAQYLTAGDSIMPLELLEGYSGPKQKNKKYTRYRSNSDGKVKFVHAVIAGKAPGKDTQVHHIDFNSKNNVPSNLTVMRTEDHIKLHKEAGTYSLVTRWKDLVEREKLVAGMHALYANADDEFKQKIIDRNRNNAISGWNNLAEETKEQRRSALAVVRNRVVAARTISYSIDMFEAMRLAFDSGYTSISKLSRYLRTDEVFQAAFRDANNNLLRDKSRPDNILPTDKTLNKLVRLIGYQTFGDWKVEYTGCGKYSNKQNIVKQNHKVVSVEFLPYTIDTGDITIESKSNSHWFGLAAGVYVHNSEGRGSKVETLPGGENLGQIDDLRFFTNKLFRALRIPSSYLPTMPDDSAAVYNDGRVGTALIQELRFNKYCQRLQNLIVPNLDLDFKIFLKNRGVNLDTSLFELRFTEPQNFSQFKTVDVDSNRLNNFGTAVGFPFISKRWAMERYLGLSQEEIIANEAAWRRENKAPIPQDMGSDNELRTVGVTPGDIQSDTDMSDAADMGGDMGDMGGDMGDMDGDATGLLGDLGSGPPA